MVRGISAPRAKHRDYVHSRKLGQTVQIKATIFTLPIFFLNTSGDDEITSTSVSNKQGLFLDKQK